LEADMAVICPYCSQPAELVNGSKIYRHRPDLNFLRFWRCGDCNAYVGCHKQGARYFDASGKPVISDGTAPLGRLANASLREAKQLAHAAFDPIWKDGRMPRRQAYKRLADAMGMPFHSCHIGAFDEDQCTQVAEICLSWSEHHAINQPA